MTLILFSTLILSRGPGIDLTVASGPPPFLTTPGPEIFAEVERSIKKTNVKKVKKEKNDDRKGGQ